MVSTHPGRGPGNALSDVVRPQALASIRAHYIDFGPTLPTRNSPNGMLAIARWRPSDQQLDKQGRPVAIYRAKHSILRVNHPDKEGEPTPFTRALKTLDIEPIHAHSPPAKGRVERAHKTLQDRLVKELRLRSLRAINPPTHCYPLPPSFSAPQSSPPKAGRLGCRESRETKATTLALPLNIKKGWPVKKDYGYRPEQAGQLQAESNTLFYWIPACFDPGWVGSKTS